MGVLVVEAEEDRWRLPWEERIARENARDLEAEIIGNEISGFEASDEVAHQLQDYSILLMEGLLISIFRSKARIAVTSRARQASPQRCAVNRTPGKGVST